MINRFVGLQTCICVFAWFFGHTFVHINATCFLKVSFASDNVVYPWITQQHFNLIVCKNAYKINRFGGLQTHIHVFTWLFGHNFVHKHGKWFLKVALASSSLFYTCSYQQHINLIVCKHAYKINRFCGLPTHIRVFTWLFGHNFVHKHGKWFLKVALASSSLVHPWITQQNFNLIVCRHAYKINRFGGLQTHIHVFTWLFGHTFVHINATCFLKVALE
jgi:hypothetical protein